MKYSIHYEKNPSANDIQVLNEQDYGASKAKERDEATRFFRIFYP